MNSILKRLCLLFVIVLIAISFDLYIAQANTLANQFKGQPDKRIVVPINQPANLNFLSAAQVLAKRKQYVQQENKLLSKEYQPSPEIFQHIEDGRPWWGMYGTYIWGSGKRSIEGPAEESRFLLNPFLLVGANPGTALIWKPDKITDNDLKDPNFPLCWLPNSLVWYPSQALAEAVYPVSRFNQELQRRSNQLRFDPRFIKLNLFGLIAYNASDFGFHYIYLDTNKSINIVNLNSCTEPVLIKQLIHCGNTSKYPGGCNNMSPAMPEIDRFGFTALPARACVYLWQTKPSSISQKPDFTFYLDFQ